ncbi:MAG: SDR family oxidoreductase [Chloroflexi bacterium]|nr:SDR family oxidoreductase [Chloroflexota bacterium]
MRLKDKVAIVTGAGSGIGRAIALAYAAEGAKVVAVGRRLGPLEETVAKLAEIGAGGLAFSADVSVSADVRRIVEATLDRFGTVDILVNCAGVQKFCPLLEVDDPTLDEIVDTNLKGVFFALREVGREMARRRKGKIINISSIGGAVGRPLRSAYCASKGGVDALTRAAAAEFGQYNINVNAIAPGIVETTMTRELAQDPENAEEFRMRIPLGRSGRTEDVVGAAIFLASAESDYITGIIITIDGGTSNVVTRASEIRALRESAERLGMEPRMNPESSSA